MSNTIDVSRIVNKISFSIDQNSYNRALKAIRKVASEWNKATSGINSAMSRGRSIGGGGRSSGAGSSRNQMGPQPFSPGQNTRNQQKASRQEASRLSRANSTIQGGTIGRDSSFVSSHAKQIAMLNQQLRNGAITTGIYNKQLNAMAREFRNASQQGKGLNGTLHELRGGFVALTASYTLFAGGASVMRTGQMFQGIEAATAMVSENAADAGNRMNYIRDEAYRLGLDLKIAANGFTQLSVASKEIMDSNETQQLFTGMSEYATALGLDQYRYEKALLGFTQIANKGQLMA